MATETEITSKNIFIAAANNDEDGFKFFVEKKNILVNSTHPDSHATPGHIAAKYGHLNILKYVVEKDPSVLTQVDFISNTILFVAIQHDHLNVVKYLIEDVKVDMNARNDRLKGNTAIHEAALQGRLNILKYFIEERNADVNIKNNFEQSPLFSAAMNKHFDIIKYLIEEKNADPSIIDHKKNNLLYVAVKANDLPLMEYLLEERKIDFDINYRNVFGDTLVHQAALLDRLDILKYLVETHHADIDILDEWGKNALHGAARKNNAQACKYLVEQGANFEVKGEDGKLPIDETENKRIIQIFETAMKKRERRSVREFIGTYYTEQSASPSNVWKEIDENHFLDRLNGNTQMSSINITSSEIQSFLILAERVLNNAKHLRVKRIPHKALLSPQQIIEEKMDAVAVDAVHTIPRLKKTRGLI